MPDLTTNVDAVVDGMRERGVFVIAARGEFMDELHQLIRVTCIDGDAVELCIHETGPSESQLDHAADTLNFAGV